MAYVPGFKYDVFVSYAHADNTSPSSDPYGNAPDSGWVAHFVDDLKRTLKQRLGGSDELQIYYDRHRANHGTHTIDRIVEDVTASAMMISVLSPSYVEKHRPGETPFTLLELTTFLNGSRGPDDLLTVEILPYQEIEPGFEFIRKHISKPFWIETAPEVHYPVARHHQDAYWARLAGIAVTLNKRLREMRKARAPIGEEPPPVRPGGPKPISPGTESQGTDGRSLSGRTVLLAQVTDDLEDERDQVRATLEQYGATILPQHGVYPPEADKFKAAFLADLAKADLVVQLLSKVRGRRPPDVPTGYTLFQAKLVGEHNQAAKAAASKETPAIQWCHTSMKADDATDEGLRSLLNGKDILIDGLEALKAEIVKRLEYRPESKPEPDEREAKTAIVFINADQSDMPLAKQLGEVVQQAGYQANYPMEGASPEQIRKDLELQLQDCDAVVVVYGDVEGTWVRAQLNQSTKFLAKRDKDFKVRALFLAPPDPKPDINAFVPNLVRLGGHHGFDPSEIRQILSRLRG